MTPAPRALRPGGGALRRWASDPLTPGVLFAAGSVLAALHGHVLTWAMIGGLAGYTLSGSV